jgi:hypothetical protein
MLEWLQTIWDWLLRPEILFFAVWIAAGFIVDHVGKINRDKAAQQILDRIERAEEAAFVLYLRPFATTGAITASFNDVEGTTEFEAFMRRTVDKSAPLVALGLPSDTKEGAGRIRVEDADWQRIAMKLMLAAKAIIVLPGPQEGTIWEIDNILANDDLRAKSVFVRPPSAGDDYYFGWNVLQVRLGSLGHQFPECPFDPAAIVMHRAGAQKRQLTLPIGEDKMLAAIKELVPGSLDAKPQPDQYVDVQTIYRAKRTWDLRG